PFCHGGGGHLLEAQDEFLLLRAGDAQQKYIRQKVKQALFDFGPRGASICRRLRDVANFCFRGPLGTRADIGTVNRERCDRFANGFVDFVTRVIAIVAIVLADIEEERGEAIDIAAEELAENQGLRFARHDAEIGRRVRKRPVELSHGGFTSRVNEEAAREIQEVVPRSSRDVPARMQSFIWGENFFGDDPEIRNRLMEAFEVLSGVTESIRMIDTKTVDLSTLQPFEYEPVGIGKYTVPARANANQGIDIEKAAVDQFALRCAPSREPVILAAENSIQRLDIVIGFFEDGRDLPGYLRALIAEPRNLLPNCFLVTVTRQTAVPGGFAGLLQTHQRVRKKAEMRRTRPIGCLRQQPSQRLGRQWKGVVV